MEGILSGVRVIDLTRYISGPYCTQMLADMGAEVIKVENPDGGDMCRSLGPYENNVGIFFAVANRNKKSITADTRTPEGVEVVRRLVAKSDVIIENFRPGVMKKLGLDYETLKAINPGIIMVSISGFGQSGPLKDRPAFDGVISAVTSVTRIKDDAAHISYGALHDHMAGMYACIGILLSLMEKRSTGRGQYVDVAMLACSGLIRNVAMIDTFFHGEEHTRKTTDSAPNGHIKAKDGWLFINAGPDPMFKRLLTFCDAPLIHEERFLDNTVRVEHKVELVAAMQLWAADKTCEEIDQLCLKNGIPCGIVANSEDLLNNVQLRELGYMREMEFKAMERTFPIIGFPVKLSSHPDLEMNSPPSLGENNEEIYKTLLEMNDEQIAELKAKGIM